MGFFSVSVFGQPGSVRILRERLRTVRGVQVIIYEVLRLNYYFQFFIPSPPPSPPHPLTVSTTTEGSLLKKIRDWTITVTLQDWTVTLQDLTVTYFLFPHFLLTVTRQSPFFPLSFFFH